ncbi:sensor histidine kinase [Nonomuraea pusilla]|uniref:sensor histidine kinase n=1 Tax=Nonomuraea pusilla TaxID=46177 RepID=UPI003328B1B3
MVREWRRRGAASPHAWTAVAGLLALAAVAESAMHARGMPVDGAAAERPARLLALVLLGLAATLPLALLPAQPAVAAVVVSATLVLSFAAFHTLTAAGACAQLIAGFRLGRTGPRLPALLAAAPFPLLAVLALGPLSPLADADPDALIAPVSGRGLDVLTAPVSGGFPTSEAVVPYGDPRPVVLLLACLAPAAALAGIAWRARGDARASDAARAAAAGALLEHTARGERARIARELHDVVAHHISLVAVQAETARLATPGMPEAGAERLSAIGDTARAALTEMRRLLGVLRDDVDAGAADLRPQPGLRLADLNALVDEARQASGTAVRLVLRGTPVELDPGVELAAYRIAQEALTNARRHAPGAAVDVELRYTGTELLLRVRDNGPGPSPAGPGAAGPAAAAPGTGTGTAGTGTAGTGTAGTGTAGTGGHGLAGMRERAAAAGGELRTGPAPGGGFLVEARLPGEVSPVAVRPQAEAEAGGGRR